MAYDFLLKVTENGLAVTKNSNSFKAGTGGIVEVRVDVKAISGTDASLQVVVQESDNNVDFSDVVMTKAYKSVSLNDMFIFKKSKTYHRFLFVVNGTSPSVNIELNQR
jgi:hypothetical protein